MTTSTVGAPPAIQPFTAPGGPYIVAGFNGKGGQGKTTTTVAYGARASQLGLRTLVVDVDPQASAYDASKAMGDACPYDVLHETDPLQLARLRELGGYNRIYVDTPGNLEQTEVLAEVLKAVDLAIVPYDSSPLARRPTFRTLGAIAGARSERHPDGVPYRVLLNKIPVTAYTASILEAFQALDAAVFCVRCGIEESCDNGCDLRHGARTLNVFIREYAPWSRAIDARKPITTYRDGKYADRARMDLSAVFNATELELSRLP